VEATQKCFSLNDLIDQALLYEDFMRAITSLQILRKSSLFTNLNISLVQPARSVDDAKKLGSNDEDKSLPHRLIVCTFKTNLRFPTNLGEANNHGQLINIAFLSILV
jgi:hypothetical protein